MQCRAGRGDYPMQTRYLGDSHDFIKFALLRHVHSQCRLRLGVNWYLTRPEEVDRKGSSDGEMRHHLTHPAWAGWDAELLDAVRHFEVPEHRKLAALEASGILPPDTLFFDEPVAQRDRESWHARATEALADADLVFLDPDNGMEVKPRSMTGRRKAKYAYYVEMCSYYEQKQAVIAIQFAGRSDPIERGHREHKPRQPAGAASLATDSSRPRYAEHPVRSLGPGRHGNCVRFRVAELWKRWPQG